MGLKKLLHKVREKLPCTVAHKNNTCQTVPPLVIVSSTFFTNDLLFSTSQ
jgi:hypothetical protein